jgi:HD-GYP domain-containing protein (c-di-GMP phosphodiesterase class II)
MLNSTADYYRKINPAFLNKTWQDGPTLGFDLFYRINRGGEDPRFMKFGSYGPDNREKIQQLLVSEDSHSLFIHETDLIKYYKRFLIANLNQSIEDGEPFEKVLASAYQVNRSILQEYFENIGSTRILRCLKDVVEIIALCMDEGKLNPIDVFETTSKDNAHSSHCSNAGLYNIFFAVQLKLPLAEVQELGLGGMLYDIGKKVIPARVLKKQEELSPEDWQAIRKHSCAGKKVLNDMKCYSQNILKMAAEHHEKYDGSGYPFGLHGNKISFPAQVCAISDIFNALVCRRYHHEPRTAFEALIEMKNNMPGHFDPQILINFIKVFARPPK